MSDQNVETVRRAVEAWRGGDMDAASAFWAQDIEWIPPPDDPDRLHVRGVDAAGDALGKWLSTWEAYRYELTELVDFGGDVLQAGRQAMDARGAEVSSKLFFVWTFRDGRAVRMRMFYHRDQALRAIGMS
jgi:ketosteroid isomerase-like protein